MGLDLIVVDDRSQSTGKASFGITGLHLLVKPAGEEVLAFRLVNNTPFKMASLIRGGRAGWLITVVWSGWLQ